MRLNIELATERLFNSYKGDLLLNKKQVIVRMESLLDIMDGQSAGLRDAFLAMFTEALNFYMSAYSCNLVEAKEAVKNLLTAKNKDYGSGNLNRYGVFGIVVRIADKVARLKNLIMKERHAVNETLEDTLLDIMGYCVFGYDFELK